jgi:hypothetical protein
MQRLHKQIKLKEAASEGSMDARNQCHTKVVDSPQRVYSIAASSGGEIRASYRPYVGGCSVARMTDGCPVPPTLSDQSLM